MWVFFVVFCCVDVSDWLRVLVFSVECFIVEENLVRGFLDLGYVGRLGIFCIRLRWFRNKIVYQMKVQYFYQQLLSDVVWVFLDLLFFVVEYFFGRQEYVFWKLVLVLLDVEEQFLESCGRILVNWLKVKFMGDEGLVDDIFSDVGGIQMFLFFNLFSSKGDQMIFVNVCIKVVYGVFSDGVIDVVEIQKDFLGVSGFMLLFFFKMKSEDMVEEDVYWLLVLLQFKQFLQVKFFQFVFFLVVFVFSLGGDVVEKEVEDGLMLQDLVLVKLILDYIVIEIFDIINDL